MGESSKAKQTSLDSVLKPRQCSESRSREITERVINMIAMDMRPIRMVECKGFKELLSFLEPGYTLPSRKHVRDIIQYKHDLGIKQLREKLSKEAVSVALTTDIWTSSATEAYITVSAHYISPNWEICSYVLVTKAFPEKPYRASHFR